VTAGAGRDHGRTPPLSYAGRCERYARQRGWHYDPQRMSIGHLTPAQRRRALRKERRSWRRSPLTTAALVVTP
jgi:hypothetical protein